MCDGIVLDVAGGGGGRVLSVYVYDVDVCGKGGAQRGRVWDVCCAQCACVYVLVCGGGRGFGYRG